MANLPLHPLTVETRVSFSDREELNDWSVNVSPTLQDAVPANINRTVITLHSHQIIIERQDGLYRVLAAAENVLLVASSLFLIGVSATSVLFALTAVSSL